MNRFHTTMTAVVLAAGVSLGAQNKDQPGKDELHVAGCVALGEQGKLVLQNATFVGVMTRTRAMPHTVPSTAMPVRSYELTGSDLKPHVGHKVEVAGTLDDSSARKQAQPSGTTAQPAPEVLRVKSVKMIASTCS